jgi:Fe-S oxidoreductase
MWWAKLGSILPEFSNLLTQTPGLRALAKRMGQIAPERRLPKFARQTFRSWFRRRPRKNTGAPKLILWPDTFSNYFHPAVAAAAVDVLESAGHQVILPPSQICCGRPLYDFGMLDLATGQLRQILKALRPEIESGAPLVGLEPSCIAVFRDEMTDLLPHDEDAKRLRSQTFTLAEFLSKHAAGYRPPRLERSVLIHGHCHQKAVLGHDADEQLLRDMGADPTFLDDGCCGMAGSFGFVPEKYDLSMEIGDSGVLAKVRDAPADQLILADGFSCRTQIEQATDRQGLHLAQLLQMALREGPHGTPGEYPEKPWLALKRNDGYAREFALGAAALAGLLYWARRVG